jgi:hypothetical protein
MSNTKAFCARPGCGIARAAHGVITAACGNYIDPTSKAGVAIKHAEAATKVESNPVDSHLLDRVLMAGALEHMQGRITRATACLQRGLSYQRAKMDKIAQEQFRAALQALGGLGAS